MARLVWIAIFSVVLMWSVYHPADQFTWFLEVLPAMIAAVLLSLTRDRFPLTPLAYVLILIHCVILMIGGHYTYAEVPLFNTLQEAWGLERNYYDKIGHLAQGFVPALVAREILIRKNVMESRAWMHFFVVCVCLAFSAFYELIEWWVALASGEDAEAFLGTQGDVWDTQSDMLMALIGACLALFTLSGLHDRQLSKLLNNHTESNSESR